MKTVYNESNAAYFHCYIQESEEAARMHRKMLKAKHAEKHARAEYFKAKLCNMMQCDGWGTGNGYTR